MDDNSELKKKTSSITAAPGDKEISDIFGLIFKELNTENYSITEQTKITKDQNNHEIDKTTIRTLIKLKKD